MKKNIIFVEFDSISNIIKLKILNFTCKEEFQFNVCELNLLQIESEQSPGYDLDLSLST